MSMADKLSGLVPEPCLQGRTLWINGEWRASDQLTTYMNYCPIDGMPLFAVARGQASDVDRAVLAAKASSTEWEALSGPARGKILRAIADEIRRAGAALGLAETIDAGRPLSLTAGPGIERAAELFEFYAGLADKIFGKDLRMPVGQSASVRREPFGVIAAICPWNYPLSNAVTKLAPILACGNTVVLKPAEQAPIVTMILPELLRRAGLPDGVVNVVTGLGGETGPPLVSHPHVAKISFTGSTQTGRKIAATAGEHLKGVVLELGGKSPLIIFDDADIEVASDAAIYTSFMNQGQTCTSCNRVLVQRNVFDEFLSLCKKKLSRVRFGNPLDAKTQVGPIISREQVDRIDALTYGVPSVEMDLNSFNPTDGGYFLKPLIAIDHELEGEFSRSEIFGPVLSIQTFDHDDEAFRLANDTEFGLAASCWTTSLSRAERAKADIQAGVVWINCVHLLTPAIPVSGHKASGLGVEYGIEAMEQYMKIKSIVAMSSTWRSPFNFL